MSFLLDNLTAILVGTTLLVAMVFVQQRGQQSAIDATARAAAQTRTRTLASTLERDIENIRTRAQTEVAFGGAGGPGLPRYRFTLRRSDDGTHTRQASFPTLADPALGAASPVHIVTYLVDPTPESVVVDGVRRPLYTVTRYEYPRGGPVRAQAVHRGVLDFEVAAVTADGAVIRERERIDPTPPRLDIEVVTVPDRPGWRAHDQRMPSATAATRHTRAVRVHGATARGGRPPVDPTLEGGIPTLPGDPPPPPSPPLSPTPGPTAGRPPSPTTSPTSGPSSGPAPPRFAPTDGTLAF